MQRVPIVIQFFAHTASGITMCRKPSWSCTLLTIRSQSRPEIEIRESSEDLRERGEPDFQVNRRR
jgi:hypothetical protein